MYLGQAETLEIEDTQALLHARTLILGETDEDVHEPKTCETPTIPDPNATPAGLKATPAGGGDTATPAAVDHQAGQQGVEGDGGKDGAVSIVETKPSPPVISEPPDVVEKAPLDRCTTQSFDGSDAGSMLEAVCNEVDTQHNYDMDQLGSMVLSPSPLPPWANEFSALDLMTCLYVSFEKGMKPDSDMQQLYQPIVTWMKQIQATPCHTMWGSQCQKAIEAFEAMHISASRLREKISAASATTKAISSAALKSYEESKCLHVGKPNKDQLISNKAVVLQKWVTTRQSDIRRALESQVQEHQDASQVFEIVLQHLAKESYQRYLEAQETQVNEHELFAEMDASLNTQMKPEEVVPGLAPPEVVPVPQTMALQVGGPAIGSSGVKIDIKTQNALADQQHPDPGSTKATGFSVVAFVLYIMLFYIIYIYICLH